MADKDFEIKEPESNIIVDPETGFKSVKLNSDGCPPGHSWNTKLGRCLKDEPNKVPVQKTLNLNKEKNLPKAVESKPRQD